MTLRVFLGSYVGLAALLALPQPTLSNTQVSCQMLREPGLGWSCPLSVPAMGRVGGELILELEYAQPLRTQVTELWEVTTPNNQSWPLVVQSSFTGGRGTLVLSAGARIESGLWHARPLGFSVTPLSVRLILSLATPSASPAPSAGRRGPASQVISIALSELSEQQ